MKKDNFIGIFDSGMGGLSVLAEGIKILPKENFMYYGDSKNAPYGVKSTKEILDLSIEICDYFLTKKVKAIVVACNTATSASIDVLREKYNIPIIGMEPAIKPAILNSKGSILVLATEVTLKEKKLNELITRYGSDRKIIKIPCPNLVEIVENGIIDGIIAENEVKSCFKDIDLSKVSTVVLGCTHFVFLANIFQSVVGNQINIIDGNQGTVKNLKNILFSMNLLNIDNSKPIIEIINSKNREVLNKSKKLLQIYSNTNV